MKNLQKIKEIKRQRRRHRVSVRVRSLSSERPRLSIRKSVRHIYAQIMDDHKGRTLVWANDLDASINGKKLKNKTEIAKAVGELLGERCKKAGIKEVFFDRGFSRYHGRVAAIADGARSQGLIF